MMWEKCVFAAITVLAIVVLTLFWQFVFRNKFARDTTRTLVAFLLALSSLALVVFGFIAYVGSQIHC